VCPKIILDCGLLEADHSSRQGNKIKTISEQIVRLITCLSVCKQLRYFDHTHGTPKTNVFTNASAQVSRLNDDTQTQNTLSDYN